MILILGLYDPKPKTVILAIIDWTIFGLDSAQRVGPSGSYPPPRFISHFVMVPRLSEQGIIYECILHCICILHPLL